MKGKFLCSTVSILKTIWITSHCTPCQTSSIEHHLNLSGKHATFNACTQISTPAYSQVVIRTTGVIRVNWANLPKICHSSHGQDCDLLTTLPHEDDWTENYLRPLPFSQQLSDRYTGRGCHNRRQSKPIASQSPPATRKSAVYK